MSVAEWGERTYLPEDVGVVDVSGFLETHNAVGEGDARTSYVLVDPDTHQQVELPESLCRILRQVVEALSNNMAVAVMPLAQKVTTQQAAELLGISRPTLIRLLDAGRVPYERVGTHRRLRLRDVLRYREERRAAQYRLLDETSLASDEEDPAEMLRSLRATRRRLAAERHGSA